MWLYFLLSRLSFTLFSFCLRASVFFFFLFSGRRLFALLLGLSLVRRQVPLPYLSVARSRWFSRSLQVRMSFVMPRFPLPFFPFSASSFFFPFLLFLSFCVFPPRLVFPFAPLAVLSFSCPDLFFVSLFPSPPSMHFFLRFFWSSLLLLLSFLAFLFTSFPCWLSLAPSSAPLSPSVPFSLCLGLASLPPSSFSRVAVVPCRSLFWFVDT